jgi:hypothetical protein
MPHRASSPVTARPGRTRAGSRCRAGRPAGARVAEVLLRRAGLAAVRRHHRAARVLPHAHRGGHPGRPRRGHRRSVRAGGPGRHDGRPGRRQLRQGRAPCSSAARRRRYVAVDISVDFLREALRRLQAPPPRDRDAWAWAWTSRPGWRCHPGWAPARRWCSTRARASATSPPTPRCAAARALCGGGRRRTADRCGPRQGPAAVLEAAYDDALGVTAAFNRNLLRHLNRLLGSRLRTARLAPRGVSSTRRLAHRDAPGGARRADRALARRRARFEGGERMHTENSYKWVPADFEALLHDAGFRQVRQLDRRCARLVRGHAGARLSAWACERRPAGRRAAPVLTARSCESPRRCRCARA